MIVSSRGLEIEEPGQACADEYRIAAELAGMDRSTRQLVIR
jgi:hypothetical protein